MQFDNRARFTNFEKLSKFWFNNLIKACDLEIEVNIGNLIMSILIF